MRLEKTQRNETTQSYNVPHPIFYFFWIVQKLDFSRQLYITLHKYMNFKSPSCSTLTSSTNLYVSISLVFFVCLKTPMKNNNKKPPQYFFLKLRHFNEHRNTHATLRILKIINYFECILMCGWWPFVMLMMINTNVYCLYTKLFNY